MGSSLFLGLLARSARTHFYAVLQNLCEAQILQHSIIFVRGAAAKAYALRRQM